MRTPRALTFLGLLMLSVCLNAQTEGKVLVHTISFSPGFAQIKDEYNYGLVNSGPALGVAYGLSSSTDRRILTYEAELDLGLSFGKGMGISTSLKPFEIFYGFGLPGNASQGPFLGPYLAGYYMWQLYPELQAGHMFWMSSYELGPQLRYSLPLDNRILTITLASSLAGFYSRPERQAEEYYYSLRLADFASNPHSNLSFGSLEKYIHARLDMGWERPGKRMRLGYQFEFMAYWEFPGFRYGLHSMRLNWKIAKNKSE